jgi:soluble lytic murein transglycosylase-like protein
MSINNVSSAISKIESRISNIVNYIDQLVSAPKVENFKAELEEKLSTGINKVNNGITKNTAYTNSPETKEVASLTSVNKENISSVKENSRTENIVQLVDMFCDEMGVDPDLIKAMISVESNFNPDATSGVGAMGLMQLMPDTARSLGVDNAYDIYQNLNGGIKMIKNLIDSFNGNVKLALAAYNAGSGRVKEYGGVPPIPETVNYVDSILSIYNPGLLQNS